MDITWTARRRAEGDGTSYTTADGRFFVRKDGNTWSGFAHVAGTGYAGHRFSTAAAARADVEAHIEREANAAALAEQAARFLTIRDRNDSLVASDYGSGNVVISARDENGATVIIIDEADRRALAAFLLHGLDEPTDAEIAAHDAEVDRSISEHEIRIAADDEPLAGEHRPRIYVDNRDSETYAYSCSCGARDGGYLVRSYARDGWREAHGLAPLVNRPLV